MIKFKTSLAILGATTAIFGLGACNHAKSAEDVQAKELQDSENAAAAALDSTVAAAPGAAENQTGTGSDAAADSGAKADASE